MMNLNVIRVFILAISLFFSAFVLALDLDQAKEKGWVGEKDNGYLGVVVAEPGVQSLIDDINTQRHAIYLELANKNNITLEQVEKLAAKKAYAKTAEGYFIWINGAWVKK